jgi:hypothetical protein
MNKFTLTFDKFCRIPIEMNPGLKDKLAQAERKLKHIQCLIDNGHLGWLTRARLKAVCRRIQKLDGLLK